MERCYFKDLAESKSKEGIAFRKQRFPYIAFTICQNVCDGHNMKCEYYELRQQADLEEETMEDSRLAGMEWI